MSRKERYEDINLCLKMKGLTPGPRLLKERRARRGFALIREETYEEIHELERALKLANPES